MCRYSKSAVTHLFFVLSLSTVFFACNPAKGILEVPTTEANVMKQEMERLVKTINEQRSKLEIEITNTSRLATELNQCQATLNNRPKFHKNNGSNYQSFKKQECLCSNIVPYKPWNIPKPEPCTKTEIHFQSNQLLAATEAEVGKNQQGTEDIHRKLETMVKNLERAEKAKAKQQRILTKEEHELLNLTPNSALYSKSQQKYNEAVQTFRELSDQHTNSVKQYVEGKKAEEELWKKYVASVQKLRDVIQQLN